MDLRREATARCRRAVIVVLVFCGGLMPPAFGAPAYSLVVSGSHAQTAAECGDENQNFRMSAEMFVRATPIPTNRTRSACPVLIRFDGEISAESAALLRKAIDASVLGAGAPFVSVVLNSPGGDLWAALATAEHVRKRNYHYVAFGVGEGDVCNSSCVLLLAGGFQRFVSGSVGIHRPYFTEATAHRKGYADMKAAYDGLYRDVAAFLRTTNVDESLATEMWRIPSHRVRALSRAELATYGLDQRDAVLVEMENASLREQCGADAPAHHEDFMEKVLGACMDDSATVNSECLKRLGSVHPYCRCYQLANPDFQCK